MYQRTPEYDELIARLVNSLDPGTDFARGYVIRLVEAVASQLDNPILFEALVDAADALARGICGARFQGMLCEMPNLDHDWHRMGRASWPAHISETYERVKQLEAERFGTAVRA